MDHTDPKVPQCEAGPACTQPQDQADQVEFSTLRMRLDQLIERFDSKIAVDEAKETAFTFLYQQLQEREEGFVDAIKRPLIHAILSLYDDVNGALAAELDPPTSEVVVGIREDILDLLANEDVVKVDASDVLDSSLHRVVKSLPTDDPAEHHRVARVVRHGFRLRDKILRPEEVVVFLASVADGSAGTGEEVVASNEEGENGN